jgi:hypothetical protein
MKTLLPALFLLASCAQTPDRAPAQAAVTTSGDSTVRPGIETFLADVPAALRRKRVGLITNHTGIDRARTPDIDLIARHPDLTLVALLAPEHGIRGDAEAGAQIQNETDRGTGVPIHSLYQAEDRAILGGVLVFADEHVWIADTPRDEQLDAWDALLADMQALDPVLVVPGHRQPATPADASALAYTREYIAAFRRIVADAADGAAATEALLKAYPQAGMQIAAQLGPKVAKGEMSWG